MSRRRAGLSFRRQRRKFNLPLFKEIVSWVVELIVVIGLAYVLVSFFAQIYLVADKLLPDHICALTQLV